MVPASEAWRQSGVEETHLRATGHGVSEAAGLQAPSSQPVSPGRHRQGVPGRRGWPQSVSEAHWFEVHAGSPPVG